MKILRVIDRLNVGGPAIHAALTTRGLNDGDWQSVSTRCGIPPQVAPVWTEQALYSLWVRYDSVPPNRALPTSEVA